MQACGDTARCAVELAVAERAVVQAYCDVVRPIVGRGLQDGAEIQAHDDLR
jgi:hypothetical protein